MKIVYRIIGYIGDALWRSWWPWWATQFLIACQTKHRNILIGEPCPWPWQRRI